MLSLDWIRVTSKRILLEFSFGIIIPLIISYFALVGIFSAPGFILYWDQTFNYDLTAFFSNWQVNAWSHFRSAPASFTMFLGFGWAIHNLGFMIPYWLGASPDFANKLWFLQNYALVGISMYFAMRILLPKGDKRVHYIGCVISSLIYMINRPIITTLDVQTRMISYAGVPIGIALYYKTLKEKRNVFRNSALTALSWSLSTTFEPLLLLLVGTSLCLQLYRIAKIREDHLKNLIKDIKKNLLIFSIFTLANFNWFLSPIVREFLARFIPQESAVIPFFGLAPIISQWSKNTHTLSTMLTLDMSFVSLPRSVLSECLRFVIPIVVFTPIILYKKDEKAKLIIAFHTILALICIISATRSPPFDSFALFIMNSTIARGIFAKFWMEPSGFIYLQCYCYSFLTAMFFMKIANWIKIKASLTKSLIAKTSISHRTAHRFVNSTSIIIVLNIVFIVISPTIISSFYPAKGNQNGNLNPTEIPLEYQEINDWLEKQGGLFRVWWIPEPMEILFDFTWASQPFSASWIWTSSTKPSHPESSVLYMKYIYLQELLEGKTTQLGKLLPMIGIKFLVFHRDLKHSQYILKLDSQQELYLADANLKDQDDLDLAKKSGFISVYENREYESFVFGSPNLGMIVGGFNVLTSLCELENFNPTEIVPVFSEQLSSSYIRRIFPLCSIIIFSEHKELEDLILQFHEDDYVYPEVLNDDPSISWSRGGGSIRDLFQVGQATMEHFNQEGENIFGLHNIISSAKGSSLSFPIYAEVTNTHDLWVRSLHSPISGELSFYLDGVFLNTINTTSQDAYYKWEKIATLPSIQKKEFIITIKNDNGTNVVNSLLFTSSSELENTKKEIMNLLDEKIVIKVQRQFFEDFRFPIVSSKNPDISGFPLYGDISIAQRFIPMSRSISGVSIYLDHIGFPNNLILEIHPSDDSGAMTSKVIAKTSIRRDQTHLWEKEFPGRLDFINLEFNNLEPEKPYWLVLKQDHFGGDKDNLFNIYHINKNIYERGVMAISLDQGTIWRMEPMFDLFFEISVSVFEETWNVKKASSSKTRIFQWNINNNTQNELKEIPSILPIAEITDYSMPFSGKYEISVNASDPFFIVIPEGYHQDWRVSNPTNSMQLPAYSFLNGYHINKTGSFTITIEYANNGIFRIGSNILILLLPLMLFSYGIKKANITTYIKDIITISSRSKRKHK